MPYSSPAFNVRRIEASEEQKLSLEKLNAIPGMKQIEKVLAAAFGDDLFTAVLTGQKEVGENTEIVGPFWQSTVIAGLLGGEVYVAETKEEEKEIVGCAVWFPPGRSMYDTEDQQEMALGPLMAMFDERLQGWWQETFLPRYDEFVNSALGAGVKHLSWHLQTLGVDPKFQRKGAASQLIDVIARKAATEGSNMCLEGETKINIEVYTKLGFKLMKLKRKEADDDKDDFHEIFTGVHGSLSCAMWVMLRRP